MASKAIFNRLSAKLAQSEQELNSLQRQESVNTLSLASFGQLTTLLDGVRRDISELEDLAKREISLTNREMARSRAEKARADFEHLKRNSDSMKAQVQARIDREALIGRNNASLASRQASDPFYSNTANADPQVSIEMGSLSRENDALRHASDQLDGYISMGKNALQTMNEDKDSFKRIKKQLLDIGVHLGMSGSVMKFIEQRSAQDKWILLVGIIVAVAIMWATVHFLT